MLAAASVIGRQFDLALLAKLVAAELTLPETLHELQRLGFVVADRRWPQPQYRFKHVLIQGAIYSTILADERRRLHRAAAEALEGHAEETPEHILALAGHWLEAGAPARAISYYRRGAELALRVFANDEAAEALTHALNLLGQAPEVLSRDEEELELTIMLGAARGWGSSTEISGFEFINSSCSRDGLRHAASARGNARSFCATLLTGYRPISSLVPVWFEVGAERCG